LHAANAPNASKIRNAASLFAAASNYLLMPIGLRRDQAYVEPEVIVFPAGVSGANRCSAPVLQLKPGCERIAVEHFHGVERILIQIIPDEREFI
jgi:hypothetical protein